MKSASHLSSDNCIVFEHLMLTVLISKVNINADHLQCFPYCRGKWNHDCLMIDGLVSQLGDQVEKLWKRDEGGTGKYPPASIHVGYSNMESFKESEWREEEFITE